MVNALPVVEYKGNLYFLDKRLNEIRDIKMPWIRISLDNLSMSDLKEVTQ